MRGFEDIANETGCVGDFYTITAPSRYHSVYSQGGFITKWNGSSPRDTQRYLLPFWARIRAALSREEIHVYGFRVVEPHHDGTPHWHMLLFMLPEHRERVQQIMREHASKEDADELELLRRRAKRVFTLSLSIPPKAAQRVTVLNTFPKISTASQWTAKKDDETGSNMRDMAKAVCAWASRWRIRQFQQIGGAPVTVWRELRRLGDTRLPTRRWTPCWRLLPLPAAGRLTPWRRVARWSRVMTW